MLKESVFPGGRLRIGQSKQRFLRTNLRNFLPCHFLTLENCSLTGFYLFIDIDTIERKNIVAAFCIRLMDRSIVNYNTVSLI